MLSRRSFFQVAGVAASVPLASRLLLAQDDAVCGQSPAFYREFEIIARAG